MVIVPFSSTVTPSGSEPSSFGANLVPSGASVSLPSLSVKVGVTSPPLPSGTVVSSYAGSNLSA